MTDRSGGFRQFDDAYDFLCHEDHRTYYSICSTPRSGSHFLGHLMYATGAMGYPLEYFDPDHFRRWTELSGRSAPEEVIEYIRSRRTSPNGCFGFKADFPQFARVVCEYRFDRIFPQCRFLLIEREDTLGQAISLVRAHQTNQWISMHERGGETSYRFEAIEQAMLRLLEERASWRRFFALTGWSYLRVSYESLVSNPGETVSDIAAYLGLGPVRIDYDKVLTQRQATAESLEWRDRFRRDLKERSVSYVCKRLDLRLE